MRAKFNMVNTRDYKGHNLVFLVGSPRSGTTWLQRLLASHPCIRTGQESKLFRSYIGSSLRAWRWELSREVDPHKATGRGGTGLSCYFREEEFMAILKNYMVQLLAPMIGDLQPGELFLEKTPAHAFSISEIKELLPESRFIHVLRDGRDVVASLLAASQSWGAGWAPNRSTSAASTWVSHVRAVKEAAKNLSNSEFYEITYEQLWAAPEPALKGVIRFLGVEWSDDEIQKAVEANRAESVKAGKGTSIAVSGEAAKYNGPVVKEPNGFIRKACPGSWKTDLSFWEKLRVWSIARKTMQEAGYSWPSAFSLR